MGKRILLFTAPNIAIVVVLSAILALLGFSGVLDEQRMGIDFAALERLGQDRVPSTLPDEVEAFGISSGIGCGLQRLFMSHPPIEERIAALRAANQGDRDKPPDRRRYTGSMNTRSAICIRGRECTILCALSQNLRIA